MAHVQNPSHKVSMVYSSLLILGSLLKKDSALANGARILVDSYSVPFTVLWFTSVVDVSTT